MFIFIILVNTIIWLVSALIGLNYFCDHGKEPNILRFILVYCPIINIFWLARFVALGDYEKLIKNLTKDKIKKFIKEQFTF